MIKFNKGKRSTIPFLRGCFRSLFMSLSDDTHHHTRNRNLVGRVFRYALGLFVVGYSVYGDTSNFTHSWTLRVSQWWVIGMVCPIRFQPISRPVYVWLVPFPLRFATDSIKSALDQPSDPYHEVIHDDIMTWCETLMFLSSLLQQGYFVKGTGTYLPSLFPFSESWCRQHLMTI